MIALAFALSYAGFMVLCLSMSRHRREVFDRVFPPRFDVRLRGLGFALLLLALWASALHSGWQIGAVLWIALLTLAALLVALMLSYAPRQMPALAAGLLPLAALFVVFG